MVQRKDREGGRRTKHPSRLASIIGPGLMAGFALTISVGLQAQTATDPGVRGGAAGAGAFQTGGCSGAPLTCLTTQEVDAEPALTAQWATTFVVNGGVTINNNTVFNNNGLGPQFSSNSCTSCHAQPAPGGSSPPSNPLFSVYQLNGAQNTMPSFETTNGPVLVPHFPYQSDLVTPDGLVQPLFVITGRSDAGGCNIAQPNFTTAAQDNNLVFRQPLPTFGDGYIEFVEDASILANQNANLNQKQALGISGVPNIAGGDGSINRFGWKAQWRAVLPAAFAEEQVEMGVTTEAFPNEMNETSGCVLNPLPEDVTQYSFISTDPSTGVQTTVNGAAADVWDPWAFTDDADRDAEFIRFLAAPVPGSCPTGGNCTNGQTQFNSVGCVLCHTTSLRTPPGSIPSMGGVTINLYSDLLLHHMGPCLADNIVQGAAQGDMWRTPPLWNVGQRYWFMHDARTNNIVTAVEDHYCAANGTYQASEANAVVTNFNALSATNQQDLIDFLRSL